MSWQPLPTAVYCKPKKAMASIAATCYTCTHRGATCHGYTCCGHLPVEEGGGIARHHEHVGRLDIAVVEGVRLGGELVLDPRKVVHNGLANGEGLQGRVRIGGRGEGEGGGEGESEGEGEGWEVSGEW